MVAEFSSFRKPFWLWGMVAFSIAMLSLAGNVHAIPWPGEAWSAATDLTSLDPADWASNLSGAYWNPETRRLWLCLNGPAKFWSLMEDGSGGFLEEREYTGTGDLEGITQSPNAPDRVFVVDEQARILRTYLIATGAASTTWSLFDIPNWGNSGPEGIAFVPDYWLAKNGFVDSAGVPYPQSVHGASGYGGLLFVGVQTNGWVYAFDLKNDGTYIFVGRYLTSRLECAEMTFDSSIGRMFINHNIDGNLLEVTTLASTVSGTDRKFVTAYEVQVPSGSNIEGFGLTPALTASGTLGDQWCFFTDDSNASGALRWFKQLHATLTQGAGDGQLAETGMPVATPPEAIAKDAFGNPLPGFEVAFTVTGGGGAVTDGAAATGDDGIARVGSWTMGAVAGTNTLSADGTGLLGSPLTFTATSFSMPPTVVSVTRVTPATPVVTGGTMTWRVEFSEDVQASVDLADFALTWESGVATGAALTAVTPVSATVFEVTASAGSSGNGVVRLDVLAGGVRDVGNNPLVADYTGGETYTIYLNPLHIAVQPAGASVHTGDAHSFFVTVEDGMPPYHYVWTRIVQSGTGTVGGDSDTLSLTNLQVLDTGTYSVEVSDSVSATDSVAAELEVTEISVPLAGVWGGVALVALVAAVGMGWGRRFRMIDKPNNGS